MLILGCGGSSRHMSLRQRAGHTITNWTEQCIFLRYCPAKWIRPKLGSFNRSSFKRETQGLFFFKARRRYNTLKGSQRMRDGRIFPKTSAPLYLMTTYRMSLISAGRTFKKIKNKNHNRIYNSRYRICYHGYQNRILITSI